MRSNIKIHYKVLNVWIFSLKSKYNLLLKIKEFALHQIQGKLWGGEDYKRGTPPPLNLLFFKPLKLAVTSV